MSADHFDLIVIGGGPAGYVGAIRPPTRNEGRLRRAR